MWRNIVGLALLGCLSAWAVRAETITVGPPPARFQTLTAALKAAQAGDTVEVQPGTYPGQYLFDKALTLIGVGKPVLRGTGQGSVVIITSDHCTLRGFVIEHSGSDLTGEDSGLLIKANDNLIEANELRDVLYGIYLYHASRNTLRGNVVRGRRALELGARGAGLHLWNSPDNTIVDNTISDARDGLYIQTSSGTLVQHNRVSRVRYGLHYMNSDDNRFEDNLFEYNVAGAAIMYSRRIELRRNAFAHNRGFSSFGILFQDCDEIVAEENFIIDNATGIFIEALRQSSFRRNVIAENDLALQMFSNADQTLFTENNFVENLSPLQVVGKRTNARWYVNGRGNYWSDYAGYDLDGNGIGDVPHKVQNVFEYLEGNYPRLRLYLNSPAAQALAAAEQSFPVLKGPSESDAAPLMQAVKLQFPLAAMPLQTAPRRAAHWLLGLLSLLFTSAALFVMWKHHQPRSSGSASVAPAD
jgi:nitrous oxidase accessory protein